MYVCTYVLYVYVSSYIEAIGYNEIYDMSVFKL